MKPVEITVRGSHAVTLPPEQATVYAQVSADGAEPQPVFDAVATALAAVTTSLQARHHPKDGPVTKFVIDQIRRGSHHPFNRDGEQLPLVHTASVPIIATFADFDDLAAGPVGRPVFPASASAISSGRSPTRPACGPNARPARRRCGTPGGGRRTTPTPSTSAR